MSLLRHDAADGENRQQHGDRNAADKRPHDADHHRLDELRAGFDGGAQVFLHVRGDAVHHGWQFTALFAAEDHLRDAARHQFGFHQRLGELLAGLNLQADILPHPGVVAVARHIAHDLQAVEHLHPRLNHGGKGLQRTRQVELVEHRAQDGRPKFHQIIELPAKGLAAEPDQKSHGKPGAGQPGVPVVDQTAAARQHYLRRDGERGFARGKDDGEFRQDDGEQEDGHADGHHQHECGIDQRAFDALGDFALRHKIIGEAFEHRAHRSGNLRGTHQAGVIFRKDARIPFQGGGKILAALHLIADVLEHARKRPRADLFGQRGQRFAQRHAGIDHDRELQRKLDHLFTGDPTGSEPGGGGGRGGLSCRPWPA